MESSVEDFASSIACYGRSGDRRLLGLIGMVSSVALTVGFYAAVGLAQPTAMDAHQGRDARPGSMTASLESADGPGGAASLALPRPAASFHGEG